MSDNQLLNRMVAEHLMGLKEFFSVNGEWRHTYDGEHGGRFTSLVPDYAGDANLAMQVVEEMRKTHFLRLDFEEDCIHLTIEPRGKNSHRFSIADPDFGRIVCLAALRARGHSTQGL